MSEPTNGFEFLEWLRQQDSNRNLKYRDYSHYLDFKARQNRIPLIGQFELSPRCNLNCKMCYVHLDSEQLSGRTVISVETWKDLMRQAWESGMMHATSVRHTL